MAALAVRPASRAARVKQWAQFARQWHLVDASHQDCHKLADKISLHLAGRHKPIWHPETDCGDHVIVKNCKAVAMHGFDWKHTLFHFDKGYPRSKADIPAWQIHEYDECRIMFLAVYQSLGNSLTRRRDIQRLHLFAEDEMPEFVRKNIGNVMTGVQPIVRRADQYTDEERAAVPRLARHSPDQLEDWSAPVPQQGRHPRQGERPPKAAPTPAAAASKGKKK